MNWVPDLHDFIVIGSGPVGIGVAIRLAEKGKRVLVLEAGRAITDPPSSHLRNQFKFQKNPDSFLQAVMPYWPSVKQTGESILNGLSDSSLLGGQGILWTNNCPRPEPFEQSDFLPEAEWNHWLEEAEAMLGVDKLATSDSHTGERIQEALAEALGGQNREIRQLPLAGRVLPEGGIHFNAPHDMLSAASEDVRNRITIRAKENLDHRFGYNRGRMMYLDTLEEGGEMSESCPVVIAGGALGTPRFLYELGLESPELMRCIRFHALSFGQIVLNEELASQVGEADIAPRMYIPPTPELPWHIQVLRDVCPMPSGEAVENPHRLLEFQAFLPVGGREECRLNYVRDGQLIASFEFSETEKVRMQAMREDVDHLAQRLGHWRQGCEPVWMPHASSHLMGTCRYDAPGLPGVADADGRVHGMENLYIASVGAIPFETAVNPTLTALSLALRMCENFSR